MKHVGQMLSDLATGHANVLLQDHANECIGKPAMCSATLQGTSWNFGDPIAVVVPLSAGFADPQPVLAGYPVCLICEILSSMKTGLSVVQDWVHTS